MDEINRVAREMVDAEPSPDLAARIRARLDAETVAPPRRVHVWHVAAGLAAAAVVTFAVIRVPSPESRVPGPASRVPSPASSTAMASNISPLQSMPSNISPVVPLRPLRHSTGARRAQAQVTRALTAEELAWMERRIPALDPVVALHMDRLSTDSIQPEALAITPLTMTALPTTSVDAERRINR